MIRRHREERIGTRFGDSADARSLPANASPVPADAGSHAHRGTAYRRVGNTTVAMPADEYNRVLLERMHSDQRWENQPAVGWSVADLDEAEIRRTVDEAIRRGRLADPGTRDPVELLRGLGLYRDGS